MGFFSIPISQVDKGLRSRRSVPYDVKRVGVAECDAVFLSALSEAPPIPLVIEPTSHCRLLEEAVVSAACDAYPFEKIRKKKPWLSDVTLKLMLDRNRVLCEFQRRRKSLFNFSLHAVFLLLGTSSVFKILPFMGLWLAVHTQEVSWFARPVMVSQQACICLCRDGQACNVRPESPDY